MQKGPSEIGAPLAALPGALDLADYAALAGRALDATPLKPGEEPAGLFDYEKYRVTAVEGASVTLAFHQVGGASENIFETPGENCIAREYGEFGLTETACNGINILSGDEVPPIVSFPDYNSAKATPFAVFVFGNSKYFVIRYGAKAQDIIGLVAAAPTGWRGLFRGRDHDLLC